MSSRSDGFRDEDSRSESPEVDYSVIRTAIKIGGKVIEQVMNGIHYGSSEVRNLLLEECDLILECKVCRNLFRSLPNFVAHKRVYCTDSYEEHKRKETDFASAKTEDTIVVQPVSPSATAVEMSASVSDNANPNQSVIEKVVNRTFEGQAKSYSFFTKVAEKVEARKITIPTSTVTLKSIPSNQNAKVMTIDDTGQSGNAASIRQITDAEGVNNRRGTEVRYRSNVADTAGNVVSNINRSKPSISQLCEKLASRSAVVLNSVQDQAKTSKISARSIRSRKSSPRKSIDSFITMKDQNDERIQIKNSSPSPSQKSTGIVENDSRVDTDFSVDMREFVVDNALDRTWLTHCDIKTLTCKTCDKSFTTPYGLKFHCKMKHVDKMIQYPCPQCTKSFTYFTALARHLRKVHTKSETYIEYVQAKLKGKLGRRKSMEDIGTDSNEGSPESLKKNMLALDTGWRKCDKCGKIFWKAKSYNRHYQYCKGKAEGSKSIESSPTKMTGQKDKEHVKKDSEELISISDKVENMKDKPTFNENLTIRTRKQAECLSQTVEKAQKSSAVTIRISEPAEPVQEKAGVICTKHEKMPSNKEYAKHIQKGKTETDMEKKEQSPLHTQAGKKISSQLFNEKAGQVNFLSVRKIQTPPEKMVMKKHVLQNESADAHNEQHIIEVHADRNIFAKLTSERVKQGNLPSYEKNKMSPGKNYATRKIVLENKNAFARKEQSSEAMQTDKDFRSKSVAEAADQGHLSSAFNLNSTGNKKRSPDRTMITRKQVSEKRSFQTVIEKDNVHVNDSSQNASLNKSSILEKEVRNQGELRKSKDKLETSGISVPPATKCLPETSEASSEGYIKPVTRGSDGTLSLKKMKTSSDDKPNSGIEAVKSPGYSKNDWKPIGKQSTNELDKKLTPAMQQDTVVMKGDNAVDLSIAVKENVCSVEDKSGNEKAKDVSSNQKGLLLTIPDLPQVKKADSTRGTLDSPTWSDNPMLKFKMTVQEMAELVESASLTKFARERKKKAKQILYKKQNGANQLAKIKNIARGVSSKAKVKTKIQVPPVKKVYGTRQSSGSKVETVTSLEKESEQGSRRYSTRNMNVKLTGDKDLSDIVEQSNKEVHKLEAPSNKNMPLSKKLNTEIAISAQPFKDLEQATLNSKRKEFLAAKRDQRRKFLLANKTASPKKVSPVKSIKSKSLKESLDTISQEIKTVHKDSRSPGSNEKRNNKAPEQIRSKLIEKFETHRTHLRSHDQDHFAANQQQLKTEESEISNKVSVDPVLTRGRPSRHSASPVQKKGYSHRSKSASSERTGRTVRQKSVSLERRRTSLPESSIFQRSRRMVRHKLLESDRYGISRRSKSSESSPSSKMHITHTAFEKENLSQSNRELRKPNTRSETTQNSSQSDNQDKNLKDDDSNIMVECVVLIQKKTVENIESPVAETKMKETDTHPHKTRLSTGSLTLNSRTSKSETESILSAAEDSSEALVSESKITLKKKRKRHFSAPQEIVKPEPKRYSLLTGVIQCERCGKAFWKKKRHTEHLKKSSCAKQNSGKSHVSNTGLKDIVQEKEMPQSCQINPMEVPKLLDTSIRNDQILDVSSNHEKNVSKSAVKRPLSTSPKPLNESCHLDNKNSVKYAESKRPRLEPNESTTRSSFHSSDMDMQLPEKNERNNESKNLAFRKVSEASSHGQERLSGESPISSELPGTSKDFFDEDSDTGSEFSGFSEADLSYPILPDDISDFESDCSLKNDAEKDSDESSCSRCSDDLGKGSNILFDKVPAHNKDSNVISVEEIWVEKEPGMPVIEKTKSNRIYVMDTDSSRKLHCQDKRNIDSFVDEDNLKCLRCEREYTSISNLRQHVIRHLGWKRYQCKMCSIFSCYNMSEVRMHLLRSHDVHIENELGLQKYVKDLNKEAGKKRSSKRMKTIKKKKEIESPVELGGISLRTKRSAPKKETDSAGTTITNKITADKTTSDSISQLITSQGQVEITSNTSIVDKNKQKRVSETQEHTILRSHDQSKTPAIEKNTASLNESAGHTVRETNGVVQVEAMNESNGPLKKSVRLAAKEDSRKSAVEILKGPKLPFSPKRPVAASKTDVKKPGSPQKVKKPTTKTTESDNKGDESLLSRARQMLATVLK